MPEGIGGLQESEEKEARAEEAGRLHLDHAVQHINNDKQPRGGMGNTYTASLRKEKQQTRRRARRRS